MLCDDVCGGDPIVQPVPPPADQFQRFTYFDATLSVEFDKAATDALGTDYWRVTRAFKFYMGDEAEQRWVFIPEGYLTDGATVPRLFWSILPPWDVYGQAAVVHDYLCEQLTIWDNGVLTPITRAQADKAFKEAMTVLEVPRWKRNVMYIAVRVYAKWTALVGKRSAQSTKKAAYMAMLETGAKPKASESRQVTVPASLPITATP